MLPNMHEKGFAREYLIEWILHRLHPISAQFQNVCLQRASPFLKKKCLSSDLQKRPYRPDLHEKRSFTQEALPVVAGAPHVCVYWLGDEVT